MTEFVIGLPVFVLIFVGMGMLYRYNNEGMVARMKTIKALSAQTKAINDFEDFTPGAGGTIAIANFGQINIPGSGSNSMYWDSGAKATLGDQFGAVRRVPQNTVAPTMSNYGPNFAQPLMSDVGDAKVGANCCSSIGDLIRGIITTLGVNLSIGAGIRYSPIVVSSVPHTFSHPWTGTYTYNPGQLDLPAPTAATHRAFPVALARLQMDAYEPYKHTMMAFNTSGGDDDMTGGGGGGAPPVIPGLGTQAEQDACRQLSEDYQDCIESPATAAWVAAQGPCACDVSV